MARDAIYVCGREYHCCRIEIAHHTHLQCTFNCWWEAMCVSGPVLASAYPWWDRQEDPCWLARKVSHTWPECAGFSAPRDPCGDLLAWWLHCAPCTFHVVVLAAHRPWSVHHQSGMPEQAWPAANVASAGKSHSAPGWPTYGAAGKLRTAILSNSSSSQSVQSESEESVEGGRTDLMKFVVSCFWAFGTSVTNAGVLAFFLVFPIDAVRMWRAIRSALIIVLWWKGLYWTHGGMNTVSVTSVTLALLRVCPECTFWIPWGTWFHSHLIRIYRLHAAPPALHLIQSHALSFPDMHAQMQLSLCQDVWSGVPQFWAPRNPTKHHHPFCCVSQRPLRLPPLPPSPASAHML